MSRSTVLPRSARAVVGGGWALVLLFAVAGPVQAGDDAPLVSATERAALGKEALPPQAAIPFADRNIESWRANGRKGLWIRAQRKWYYAELFIECPDLPWAESVGFLTGGPGSFDRYSYILVRGERYPLRSLTASSEPPREQRKRGKKAPPAAPASAPTEAPTEAQSATPPPSVAPAAPATPAMSPEPPVKPESSPPGAARR